MIPKVSIIIPTRNRANLLRSALLSVANIQYPDIEVVVCDNNSSDDTGSVVGSFKKQYNILYHKTSESLSMPDNWERAIDLASGDYFTFLTDDSYIFPDTVVTAIEILSRTDTRVAVWKHCAYFTNNWLETSRRNIVYIPNTSGESIVVNSRQSLSKLFDMKLEVSTTIPKMLNCIVHRSVISKAKERQGRFFLPSCPDYSSAASILLETDRYVLIDQPLYIDSVTPHSIGAVSAYNRGPATQACVEEFQPEVELAYFGVITTPSGVAQTITNVKKYYGSDCPDLNLDAVIKFTIDRLMKLKLNGVDIQKDISKLTKAPRNKGLPSNQLLLWYSLIYSIKWKFVQIVRSHKFLRSLEKYRGFQIIQGDKYGFQNIEECGKFVLNSIHKGS